MNNVNIALNLTEKQDEKIESIKREISSYEKELTLLEIKNESNPGKKIFWTILEVIGWIITSFIGILFLASGTHESGALALLLIFDGIPFLLTLMFRHFKNLYTVKEEALSKLQKKY
ncbi:hypothetical protein [Clostridium sp.]|uniref:hypothetical protein n=1 Tax=Clostridium sp. TaxID=1506 RepID=UPI00283FD661|nr:hypothetical protein [Clostridium sp.]MDR3597685.1 hypothetical protein [Clostridium sp.]